MNEHAPEIVPILWYGIVALLLILKGFLLLGYRLLKERLDTIHRSLDDRADQIHCLEIRVAKIETRLGIPNGAPIKQ